MNPPRKEANKSFDNGINVKGASGQNSDPPKKIAGPVDKSVYRRKPAGVNATNLPHRSVSDK